MKIRVAIFSSHGLGDGLIQLVLANNLFRNGYEVTYYSDFVSQLDDYIEGIQVLPFPDYEQVQADLDQVQLILYDSFSNFVRQLPKELDHWFSCNGIAYSNAKAQPLHQEITVEQLKRRLPETASHLAERFILLNRSFRGQRFKWERPPIVHQLLETLSLSLGLKNPTIDNGLSLRGAKIPLHEKRVVIHPTSSSVKKNWSPQQFIELANRLKNNGWEPVFTVAPSERKDWLQLVSGRFIVPEFLTIRQLAEFYQGAVFFIGNDSGNAHLASCLGLPTLVIFNRWRKYPPWRPGWAPTQVIYPRTLIRKNWQRKVTVDRVLGAFEKLLA